MKLKMHEAARVLGIHPFNLMLYLIEIGVSFEDIWPEMDENIIEAVRGQDWQKFSIIRSETMASLANEKLISQIPSRIGISQSACQIIEKLWRNQVWGKNCISLRTIQNDYCRKVENIEMAIQELLLKGLLISRENGGPFSLNPRQKIQIEDIAKLMIEKR